MSEQITLSELHRRQRAEQLKQDLQVDNEVLFLNREQCAKRYAISCRTWDRWVKLMLAPQPLRVAKTVRWCVRTLQAWEQSDAAELGYIHERDRAATDAANTAEWTSEPGTGPRVSDK